MMDHVIDAISRNSDAILGILIVGGFVIVMIVRAFKGTDRW